MRTRRGGTILGGRGQWEVDLGNCHLPRLSFHAVDARVEDPGDAEVSFVVRGETRHYRRDPNAVHVALSWGEAGCDPVWGLYLVVWAPRFLARRAEA